MTIISRSWKLATRRALALVAVFVFATTASSQTITYIHTDHLGSPTVTTNSVGQVLWSATRSSFGEVDSTTGQSTHGPIGYTGGWKDPATGFVYLQNRYYDPSIGRFISVDDERFNAESAKSFNRYVYANNNPYRYVDPDGRIPVDTVADVGFVIIDTGILIWDEVFHGGENRVTNLAALSADAAGILIPYATGLGIAARVGKGAKGAAQVAETAGNYRARFLKARPDLPDGWVVHHSIPQRYADMFKNAGVNLQETQFLRGIDPKKHEAVTKRWADFHRANKNDPTAAQIAEFAKQLDRELEGIFMFPGF